eukprot:CAMPEP_0168578400 /NCGR_PEP_ID=MMETSP0413-20121227/21311_1 /TAXON_ID=136452 /ORGANISM="Filamoeba nolandi, Strain NC-AS-23-1" /LENGTH=75 /DNA_ID=CAMNT_0008612241 /DNA_START=424 /DNA_END=648 /DNA_ORIENTATION=-
MQSRFEDTVTEEIHWKTLCLILNTAPTGGWRDLGAYLGHSAMELDGIYQEATFKQSSPAKLLLQEWQHKENATVK